MAQPTEPTGSLGFESTLWQAADLAAAVASPDSDYYIADPAARLAAIERENPSSTVGLLVAMLERRSQAASRARLARVWRAPTAMFSSIFSPRQRGRRDRGDRAMPLWEATSWPGATG